MVYNIPNLTFLAKVVYSHWLTVKDSKPHLLSFSSFTLQLASMPKRKSEVPKTADSVAKKMYVLIFVYSVKTGHASSPLLFCFSQLGSKPPSVVEVVQTQALPEPGPKVKPCWRTSTPTLRPPQRFVCIIIFFTKFDRNNHAVALTQRSYL